MPNSQHSRTIITLGSIKDKTSITVVLLAMTFSNGTIVRKFRTVSLPTSPSASLCKNRVCVVKLTHDRHSLVTGSEYVRGKLADHANELLRLGTDGLRIDAAKRESHIAVSPNSSSPMPLSDMPVDDLRAIFGRLYRQPSYVTQEVRAPSAI